MEVETPSATGGIELKVPHVHSIHVPCCVDPYHCTVYQLRQSRIRVKTLDGRVFSFTVTADMVVKDFKQLVADKIDVPVEKQRIIFRGK
eukprot:2481074-Rhodomonas_salina.1